jgi:hypothetical protein
MMQTTFVTCPVHPACVLKRDGDEETHIPGKPSTGSAHPPSPRLQPLSLEQSEALYESVRSALDAQRDKLRAELDGRQFVDQGEVAALRAEIGALRDRLESATSEASSMFGRLAPKESMEALIKRVESLETAIAVRHRRSPVQPKELEAVRAALADQIADVRVAVSRLAHGTAVDSLERRIAYLEPLVKELHDTPRETIVAETRRLFDEAASVDREGRAAERDALHAEIREQLEAFRESFALRAEIEALRGTLNDGLKDVRAQARRAADKEGVEGLRSRVETIEVALAARQAPVQPKELEAVRSGLSQRVDEVRDKTRDLAHRSVVESIEQRMGLMEERVRELSSLPREADDNLYLRDAVFNIQATLASHAEILSRLRDLIGDGAAVS